jgi:Uma2 family endonuclease
MSISIPSASKSRIIYPDCDGKPIADNTVQFRWIVTIKEGLERLFHDRPDVFVAGDLLWYPVEGRPDISIAPDALVAFGRPSGDRGSYKQWEEGGAAPQVVFEVLSPNNRFPEMLRKLKFYEQYGVEEYYVYDPDHNLLDGWQRVETGLDEIPRVDGWTSPRLGVRFDLSGNELAIYDSTGQRFLSYQELAAEPDRLAQERDRLAQERDREVQRAERLAAQLRALGLEPTP